MKRPGRLVSGLLAGLLAAPAAGLTGEKDVLLRVEAAYLAYSYDHGRLFGTEVEFDLGPWRISARILRADFPSRTFLASGEVSLRGPSVTVKADECLFDVVQGTGILFRYGQEIEISSLPGAPALEADDIRRAWEAVEAIGSLSLAEIRGSLISFTAKAVDVLPGFEVVGYDVVSYFEGVESVGFRKFKLSLGQGERTGGLALDKVWFNRTQGLFANLSYGLEREKKVESLTELRYEEHSLLKSYRGRPRQLDVQTSSVWTLGAGRTDLGLAGNYNSTGLWNARLFLNRRFGETSGRLLFDLAFIKPLDRPEEAWLGVQTNIDGKRWGVLNFSGKLEAHNQALAGLAYSVGLLDRLRLSLSSAYSRVRLGGFGGVAKLWTSDLALTYLADAWSAAADYHLNRDLAGRQSLHRPQLRIGLNPFAFYGGLLTASFRNVFVANDLRTPEARSRSYTNNTALSMTARPVYLRPDFSLQAGLALEQFLEKEGRNFTSGGVILRGLAELSPAVSLEAFTSLQSRRRTKGWLIEGTTSRDVTAMLRIRPEARLNGWLTISYDPKAGEWKPAYADLAVGLVRNWEFQTLLSLDFERRRLANIDLSLVRHAGRFDLRFVWRSISRQLLIELIPALGRPGPPETGPDRRR
ncbi:MAG: hypothetical protein FJY82_13935 [Candidatus Aminicenantes bacterium]|nr:hypothetical protein [Candidatus Aminicenantes bacterium]